MEGEKDMNVGVYSFENMTDDQIEALSVKIRDRLLVVENIYIYSENTQKQRLSKRDGLKKIIQDYEQKKIAAIVFEGTNSLGADDYIKGKVLEILMEKEIKFLILKENIESTSAIGKQMIQILISLGERLKEMNDKRSKNGNIHMEKQNNIAFYTRVANKEQINTLQ